MLYQELIGKHKSSDCIILSDGKQKLTYSELDELVQKQAEQMKELGVKAGMRVLIRNENTIQTAVEILACIYLHVCFLPLPEEITEEQLAYIVADSQAVLLIDHAGKGSQLLSQNRIDNFSTKEKELIYILYTSGSTGKPKGVMASYEQVIFCINAINQCLGNGPEDCILCALPLSFDYGLYQLFLALHCEAKLILYRCRLIQQIPAILKKERITAFPSMPAMIKMMLKAGLLQRVDLPDLRYISSTGENFEVELICRIRKLFPHIFIFPMYGLTECKRVSIMPQNRWDKVLEGSCGIPLPGTKVYLENVRDDGVGELIVSGPNVMEGYWNDNSSQDSFFEDDKGKKCLRTGDYFYIDKEGFLYFRGRKKRILKTNGHRISCLELEIYLKSYLKDDVEEIRIIGVPSEIEGERIIACLQSQQDICYLKEQLQKIVLRLPQYQRPHSFFCTKTAFALNINGKIDENRLRECVKNNELYKL